MLPDELLSSLNGLISCREAQTRQLVILLDSRFPNPSTLVIHGLHATGKSLTLGAVLASIDVPSAVVRSRECITTRHLLERAISDVKDAMSKVHRLELNREFDGRCESISAFVVQLQLLLQGEEKFVLVFDGIDRQREALPTLLPAIARLGEIISKLTVVLVITAPQARALQLAGVPHIHFPPYTRAESLSIVSSSPLPIIDSPQNDEESQSESGSINQATFTDADSLWLWTRFCGAVWDSLGQAAARDIVSFRAVCSRLWKPFVKPVGQGDHGPREFSKLMVKNRALFQSEDPLKEPILSAISTTSKSTRVPLLRFPHHTSHLLLAAYLASYTPPRTDTLLYSKSSQHASRRRRRQQRKPLPATTATSSRRRKIPRHLLGPQSFPLERLFAIFHATSPFPVVAGGELMAQVATLAGLSLLLRASSAAADEGSGGGGGKWKVGFGWEFAAAVARGVEFDLEDYLGEQKDKAPLPGGKWEGAPEMACDLRLQHNLY